MLTIAEIIRRALDSRQGEIFTALPGEIQAYAADVQTADVLPLVKRPLVSEDGEPLLEDLPIVPNVPILFPRGGGCAITWPIAPGDAVLLVFMTYPIAQWRRTGKVAEPGDLRLHSLGSAVAIPGLGSNLAPIAFGADSALVVDAPEIKIGAGAVDFAAMASKVMDNLNALKTAISSASVGGSPLTWSPPAFSDVAAQKAKIE